MAIMNFNYNQALRQASQVEAVANEMLAVANRQLETTVNSIRVCWRGEASEQFLRHCTATQTDIKNQAKKLQDLAKRIRKVAQIIKEAEERAKELQRQRDAASTSGSGGGFSGGGGAGGGGVSGGGRGF